VQFRRSELLLTAFFLYAAVASFFFPPAPVSRATLIALNLAVIGWFCLFAFAHKGRGFRTLDYVRDWYPVPLILLAYREMGWLAQPYKPHHFENYWISLDRWLLNDAGFRAAVESAGILLPNVLELSYLLVYGVPVYVIAIFYTSHVRERIDDAYSIVLLGTLTAYAMYPFFPSDPPRTLFAGQDLPSVDFLMRRVNLAIVGNFGIHTSVFPSGHTAAAFSTAFAVLKYLPERRWIGYALLVLASSISLATIYGRYHFAIDAVAGFAVAGFAWSMSLLWDRRAARKHEGR
jgi:membrane-associated phospholipid phosphatase